MTSTVDAFATTSNKKVTICANKKSNALRYAKNGKCLRTETRIVLNQRGVVGAAGPAGQGGISGATGAPGERGAPGGLLIEELWVCDGPDVDLIANEKCKVGMTGPGGGTVFFIDYMDQYPSFNYLEVSPVDVIEVGVGVRTSWCSNSTTSLGLNTWSARAVGAGARNTARMLDSSQVSYCESGAAYAASRYSTNVGGAIYDDWFLPSLGELKLMYTNLGEVGAGNFTSGCIWTSTEASGPYSNGDFRAWSVYFDSGFVVEGGKTRGNLVRAVRAF
jgi:hypothetical protein